MVTSPAAFGKTLAAIRNDRKPKITFLLVTVRRCTLAVYWLVNIEILGGQECDFR